MRKLLSAISLGILVHVREMSWEIKKQPKEWQERGDWYPLFLFNVPDKPTAAVLNLIEKVESRTGVPVSIFESGKSMGDMFETGR
jgi:hypothetical protein